MHTSRMTKKLRLVGMSITVLAMAALAVFGASWATPARADGCGTVPGSGCGNGGSGGNSNGNGNGTNTNGTPNADVPAFITPSADLCGSGPQAFSISAPASITTTLNIGIGSVKLWSDTGGVGNGAVKLLFVPITNYGAHLFPPAALPTSPAGWTNLGCGIVTSGKVSDGQPVTYILKGQQICFTLPVGAAAAYSSLRIAYFDTRLSRWVFLNTTVNATQACHSSFRLAPATFALFGSA
jgi:hypothetical protein